jgi:hypothetical protein
VKLAKQDEIRFAKNIFKFQNLDPFLSYHIKLGVFKGEKAEVVCAGQLVIDSHEFKTLLDQTETHRMVKLFLLGEADEVGQAFLQIKLELTSFEY